MGGDRGRYLGTGRHATQRHPGPTRPGSLCRDVCTLTLGPVTCSSNTMSPLRSSIPRLLPGTGSMSTQERGGPPHLLQVTCHHSIEIIAHTPAPSPFWLHFLPLHFHHLLYILHIHFVYCIISFVGTKTSLGQRLFFLTVLFISVSPAPDEYLAHSRQRQDIYW